MGPPIIFLFRVIDHNVERKERLEQWLLNIFGLLSRPSHPPNLSGHVTIEHTGSIT